MTGVQTCALPIWYVALTGCTPKVLAAVAIAAHKTADVISFFIFSPLRAVTQVSAFPISYIYIAV